MNRHVVGLARRWTPSLSVTASTNPPIVLLGSAIFRNAAPRLARSVGYRTEFSLPLSTSTIESSARIQNGPAQCTTLPFLDAADGHRRIRRGWISHHGSIAARRFQSQKAGRDNREEHAKNIRSSREVETGPSKPSEQSSRTFEEHGSKHILDRLPQIHRPTKEELLAAASGFWHRVQIRFKWFSIRSMRPFNTDDIGAFLSWIFWGHVLWIVVGTTTFVSLAILAVNTVFAQETLAGWVGNYLTKSSGIKVVFESAIVPTWSNGVITFNNVFVSRRPGLHKNKGGMRKGSSLTAAAAAEAAQAEKWTTDGADEEDDGNYSQFDVTIDTVNVTLSFTKWFNGRGLLRDVEVRGVRGVIDRTSVHPTGEILDPKSYRHTHNTGDFEIDNFKMEDVLLTVYQPNNFRPFTVSVYNCELPRLRKQWLFYDFMSANNMSGSFDDSLFTIHPRQIHGTTGMPLVDGREPGVAGQWKKHTRLRIDGLRIDHLNRGVEGPFSWIQEGNVDIVADVMIPNDDSTSLARVVSEFYDRMEATVTAHTNKAHDGSTEHDAENTQAVGGRQNDHQDRLLVLDMRVHLNDVRAHVPIFTKDLSYVNNALVRPIVAYINSRRAFIPVHCRVIKEQSEFDGSWTIFDSGLLNDLSKETYEAFSRDIMDHQQRSRRIKKVGLWTIQLAAQALFVGLAGQLA